MVSIISHVQSWYSISAWRWMMRATEWCWVWIWWQKRCDRDGLAHVNGQPNYDDHEPLYPISTTELKGSYCQVWPTSRQVELVSEPMKGLLMVLLNLLKKMLLVEECLKALNCSADLLVKDPNNSFGWLLLEVWERAAGRCWKTFSEWLRSQGWGSGDASGERVRLESQKR